MTETQPFAVKEKKPTGAAAVTYRRDEMRPLPMRISQKQYEDLLLFRDHDSIPVQEHVRRAVAMYAQAQHRAIATAAAAKAILAAQPLAKELAPYAGAEKPSNVNASPVNQLPKVRSK